MREAEDREGQNMKTLFLSKVYTVAFPADCLNMEKVEGFA